MDKIPRGRPPRSKNVLNKLDSIPQESEDKLQELQDELEEVKQEPTQIEVKEKKPRTEKQQMAMQKMVEANKAKRQIKIVETEVPDEVKPVKIETKPNEEYATMFKQLNDRLSQYEQKKEPVKTVKTVKTVKDKKVVKENPVKEVKQKPVVRKRIQKDESSESDEEESDDEYVERYKKKAEKRFEAVRQIEERLQQVRPKGKYDHISLFK